MVLHGVLVALDQVVVVGSVSGALLETDRAGVLGLVSLLSLVGLLLSLLGRGLLLGLVLVGDSLLGGLLGGGDRVLHDLLAGNRLQHQGDDRHGGVVALAGGRLDDAGVTALAALELGGELLEEAVDGVLVRHLLQHGTAGVQVTALALGDELLDVGTQATGASLRGLDRLVNDELRGQVGEQVTLVLGAAAQTGTLSGARHGCLLGE